jgi:hypothetical protein
VKQRLFTQIEEIMLMLDTPPRFAAACTCVWGKWNRVPERRARLCPVRTHNGETARRGCSGARVVSFAARRVFDYLMAARWPRCEIVALFLTSIYVAVGHAHVMHLVLAVLYLLPAHACLRDLLPTFFHPSPWLHEGIQYAPARPLKPMLILTLDSLTDDPRSA